MVEGEDPENLGAGEVERRGDHRDCRLRHITESLLQRMQDHEGRAFKMGMFGDDLGATRLIPGFVV
jgi:hypothetical protein